MLSRSILTGTAERIIRDIFAKAGVTVGGPRPFDITVHDRRFYGRVLRESNLGLGESYMDGWWDCEAIDQLAAKLIAAGADRKVGRLRGVAYAALAKAMNLQSAARAFQVGERHYDIGNDLYEAMLGKSLCYTCGYWKDAKTLDEAQEAKMDLVCRKVGLRPGMRILELGCGWGSFAKFAAERYGVEVVGYTVSKEQVALGMERCAGLPVDLRLDDYRNARGRFDAVISIGIMEHVGPKNYRAYMETADRCLAPGGVAFVHTIAGNWSTDVIDPWFHKHIFPNAVLPTVGQMTTAAERIFIVEDVHNFGPHYDPTLMAWYQNFEAAWPRIGHRYGERFRRMWRYYLLSCAGGFRARYTQLFQLVMTRLGTSQPDCRQS